MIVTTSTDIRELYLARRNERRRERRRQATLLVMMGLALVAGVGVLLVR